MRSVSGAMAATAGIAAAPVAALAGTSATAAVPASRVAQSASVGAVPRTISHVTLNARDSAP